MSSMVKDYYYILGITPDAETQDIKRAYRKLSLKFHPDKNQGDSFFEERFKEINEAYETLIDPQLREEYDLGLSHCQSSSKPKIEFFKADKSYIIINDPLRNVVKFQWECLYADKAWLNSLEVPVKGTKSLRFSKTSSNKITIELRAISSIDETSRTIEIIADRYHQNEKEEYFDLSQTTDLSKRYHENFFSPKGRIRRSTYFVRALVLSMIVWIIGLAQSSEGEGAYAIFSLIAAVLMWIQFVKRLHDINLSGWYSLLTLVPIVNLGLGLYVLFKPGTKGANQFGPDPKSR